MKHISLLIVDDSSINQRVVTMALRATVGKIESAGNGLEALQKYQENRFDVIVMDGRMPVMDGYECTRKIREFESENAIEKRALIIALTGSDTEQETETCLRAGMDACMLKPFRVHEFLEIIKSFN
jgi:CheY-like chemotaxis protein